MLMLDVKADKGGQSPLSLLPGKESGDPKAFDRLLKGLTHALGKGKSISSDRLALLLDNGENAQAMKPQSEMPSIPAGLKGKGLEKSLLTLLHGEKEQVAKESDDMLDIKVLNPKITADLPAKELTALIKDAKAFLKAEISRISDVEEMPKTLKGLLRLAEKVGVDVSKISFEQMPTRGNDPTTAIVATPKGVLAKESDVQKPVDRSGIKAIPTAELIQQRPEPESKEIKKSEPLQTLLQKREGAQTETTTAQPRTVEERVGLKDIPTATLRPERPLQHSAQPTVEQASSTAAAIVMDKRSALKGKEEETSAPKRVLTTATLAAKASEQNIPLVADETTLAQENGKLSRQPLFTSALNELLYAEEGSSESKEESTSKSVDLPKNSSSILSASSKDPLELKMNEAKQTMRHFASDIKEAVQNYKPPFTRLKIQLNPVKLGEVDVTMIQRGNNLHINISSNTTAITTLSQNATELRTQLSQNGMGNTTMNFSSNADSEQQQQQQRQHLADLYEEYSNGEEFELMDSLDLIIPRYV